MQNFYKIIFHGEKKSQIISPDYFRRNAELLQTLDQETFNK